MPRVTRLLVRAALLWLVAGLAVQALASVRDLGPPALASALAPAALHAIVVGWLTQLAFGVAAWLLPRPRGRNDPLTGPWGLVVFGCLNSGLLLRFVAEPAAVLGPGPPWHLLLVPSGLLQLAAVSVFVVGAWSRVAAPRAPASRRSG